MEKHKTHYRKVMKSDHLGTPDLEDMIESGHNLILVIKKVCQEYGTKVAGKKIDANIAYFTDTNIKPLVLNSTNSKMIKTFTNSPFVEDWVNVPIQLYIDQNVKMKGVVVGGVRISPKQPVIKKTKTELTPSHLKWEAAKKAIKDGGTNLESILKSYSITEENQKLLIDA